MNKDIPVFSLQRLPVYLNYLRGLSDDGENNYISSGRIAKALGFGEVLVRKDLAYSGCAGRPKVGYPRAELIGALEEFLCVNARKTAVIIGAGGLGSALLSYGGFEHYGFEVPVAFDSDPAKIGTTISGKPVLDVKDLEKGCREAGAVLAIIAVPASAAHSVGEQLKAAGIKAILNFAPVQLNLGEEVKVINMDVAANLAVLSAMI